LAEREAAVEVVVVVMVAAAAAAAAAESIGGTKRSQRPSLKMGLIG
jgi:hypothetical protein